MTAIGDAVEVSGFVTQGKFLVGRTLRQVEALIGFQPGHLGPAASIATLDRMPVPHEVETFWFPRPPPDEEVAAGDDEDAVALDAAEIKRIGMSSWATTGPGRLVKVWPAALAHPHFANRLQIPPRGEAPLWWLVAPIPGRVAAHLHHGGDVLRLP